METYSGTKPLVDNPYYREQRQKALAGLTDGMIDRPIVDLVQGFNRLPFCFTLQACYGHFVFRGQEDRHNLAPLPPKAVEGDVEYRIAYIALCIENSPAGRALLEKLETIPAIDTENVQFCCAEWFWERQVNSYALQVEPDRFKRFDTARIGLEEARYIERLKQTFFDRLRAILSLNPG